MNSGSMSITDLNKGIIFPAGNAHGFDPEGNFETELAIVFQG